MFQCPPKICNLIELIQILDHAHVFAHALEYHAKMARA